MDNKQILEALDDIVTFREESTSEQIEALMEAMDIVEKYSKIGDWIPCSERLPDKDGKYICTQKIYNLSNGKLSRKSVELVEFYNGKWRRAKHLKVIAWQPLPEAYHG